MTKLYDTIMKGHEIEPDKARHCVFGGAIGCAALLINRLLGLYIGADEVLLIIITVVFAATAWEVWQANMRKRNDRKYLVESFRDILATTAGSIFVAFPLLLNLV